LTKTLFQNQPQRNKRARKGTASQMDFIRISRGMSPLVLGLPHTGTYVPERIWKNLNPNGQILADTDWHIHKIYDGLLSDVTTVRTLVHRYVIDVNRDPNGKSLYI